MTNTDIITITVTVEEANAILTGLQELPAKIANPITNKIQSQAQAQIVQKKQSEQGIEPGAVGVVE
jgi:hypothetical protein